MIVDKRIIEIRKYLQRKKEKILFEIIIKNYNHTNFYISLVFNKKIEKFKVVYIPIDIIKEKVEYYICYQFINILEVKYIIDTIYNSKDKYKNKNVREKLDKETSQYYIEINTDIKNCKYSFKANKYIPKEWLFMFDCIVIMFEHTPNIMSELCKDILEKLTNSEKLILYNISVPFELKKDNIDDLFNKSNQRKGLEYYQKGQVKYIEKVNDKYYAIVKDHIVIIEYNHQTKMLNTFCDCSCHIHGKHIYAVICAIKNKEKIPFTKLMLLEDINDMSQVKYYLCYGIENDNLKVIEGNEKLLLPIDLIKDGYLKIIEDKEKIIENNLIS